MPKIISGFIFGITFICAAYCSAESDHFEFSVGENRALISQREGVLINPQWSPVIDAIYRHDGFFIDTENGIGYRVLSDEKLKSGVALDYQYGRREQADSRYRGLGNVNGSVAPAVFVEWEPIKDAVDLYVNASKAVAGSTGWLYKMELTAGLPINSRFNFYIDIATHAGDKNYAQNYYGVSVGQSLSSYYSIYRPSGGFLSMESSAGIQFQYSKNFSISTQAGRSQYLNSAAQSPLVNHRNALIGGIYATYMY